MQSSGFEIFDMLARAQLTGQAIYIVAKLRIADCLKDGAKSIEELAEETKTHPDSLYRLLRMLASIGIFTEIKEKGEGEGLGRRFRSSDYHKSGSARRNGSRQTFNQSAERTAEAWRLPLSCRDCQPPQGASRNALSQPRSTSALPSGSPRRSTFLVQTSSLTSHV